MSIGENLRALRMKRGLTQGELAEMVGVTRAFLCQIERGTKNPSLQVSVEIARVLQCNLGELVEGA